MRKKIIFAVAAVVVFAFVVWNLLPGPRAPQSVQFADGTTFTFLGVTSGATNSIMVGKGWQKVLYKLLPARFQSWSHARLFTSGLGGWPTNSPVFWFDERRPQQFSAPPVERRWTVIDEFGCGMPKACPRAVRVPAGFPGLNTSPPSKWNLSPLMAAWWPWQSMNPRIQPNLLPPLSPPA